MSTDREIDITQTPAIPFYFGTEVSQPLARQILAAWGVQVGDRHPSLAKLRLITLPDEWRIEELQKRVSKRYVLLDQHRRMRAEIQWKVRRVQAMTSLQPTLDIKKRHLEPTLWQYDVMIHGETVFTSPVTGTVHAWETLSHTRAWAKFHFPVEYADPYAYPDSPPQQNRLNTLCLV